MPREPDDRRTDYATHDSGIRNAAHGTGSERHRFVGSEAAPEPNQGVGIMADDKSNRGAQDRSRVAGEQQYEVAYFAKKHGLTMEKARAVIAEAGPSQKRADDLAAGR